MVRLVALLALSIALAGCKTLGAEGLKTTMVTLSSTPAGALATVEGFGECETPCTIEIDKPRNVTVAKAGYDPQKITLQPGRKKVDLVLKLSAPTTGVDATEMPDVPVK